MRVTSRYCEQCGIKIPLEDIRRGSFLEHNGDYYCMQCRDEVLPRLRKKAGGKPIEKEVKKAPRRRKKVGNSTKMPSLQKKKSKSRRRRSNSSSEREEKNRRRSISGADTSSSNSSNQLALYGAVAAILGIMMISLLWALASSNSKTAQSENEEEKTEKKKDQKKDDPTNKAYEYLQNKLASIKGDPSRKAGMLKRFLEENKVSGSLRDKIEEQINENRFLAAEKYTSKSSLSLLDKIATWKRVSKKLRGTKWEEKAQKNLADTQKKYETRVKEKAEAILSKAKGHESKGEFFEAKYALDKFPDKFGRDNKYWKEKLLPYRKTIEEKMRQLENFNQMETDVHSMMAGNDYKNAISTLEKYIDTASTDRYRDKAKELLKKARKEYEKYREERKEELEKERLAEKKKKEEERRRKEFIRALNSGNWVTIFDGQDLDGWKKYRGNWNVSGNVLTGSSTGNPSLILFRRQPFKDFSVEVSAKIDQGYGFGVVLRAIPLVLGKGQPLPKGKWIRFTLEVSGNQVKISGDLMRGQSQTVNISSDRRAYVGLLVPSGGKVQFQNIRIKKN